MSQPRRFPGKYAPLNAYLAAVPADQDSVRLTLAEIETFVGPLSLSARATTSYWTASSMAPTNWGRLGFTAALNRVDKSVIFTRRR